MTSISKIFVTASLITSILVVSTGIFAHRGATGVVKDRMVLMKEMGKAMKTISKMVRGKAHLDMTKLIKAAELIGDQSRQIDTLFPKGSGDGLTEASLKIWQDRAGFRESARMLGSAADSLRAAATTNQPKIIKSAFRTLGKSCSSCHKLYRTKKK